MLKASVGRVSSSVGFGDAKAMLTGLVFMELETKTDWSALRKGKKVETLV